MSGSIPPSYGGKPAAAVLDYAYDFSAEIAANEPDDVITVAQIAVEPEDGSLAIANTAAASGKVTFWASGGIPGTAYWVEVIAQTNNGRVIVSEPRPQLIVV